jgi:AcrR family transcriptional regulator
MEVETEIAPVKKGERTKRRIIETAKREFYKKGYDQTTIKDITDKLKYKPSLVTHYFQKKENIVNSIFEDLFIKMKERVDSSQCTIPNSLLFHFVWVRLVYRLYLKDEPTKRFYYQINKNGLNYMIIGHLFRDFYTDIIKDFNLPVADKTLSLIQKYEAAGRRDFVVDFIDGKYPDITIDDALNIFERIVPAVLRMDMYFVDSMLLASIDIAKSIDISDLRFLV